MLLKIHAELYPTNYRNSGCARRYDNVTHGWPGERDSSEREEQVEENEVVVKARNSVNYRLSFRASHARKPEL